MRNLAKGLISNFSEDILRAAFFLRDYNPDPYDLRDTGKKRALEILHNFEQEVAFYSKFRLEKKDMQEIGGNLVNCIGPYDFKFKEGKLDTLNGNESITLRTGVVVASIIGNQKMMRTVREYNTNIAEYLNLVYKIYTIDPGDKRISEISIDFVNKTPLDAEITMNLLERLTKNFKDEIERIPEDEDYFTRHIFNTGFVDYPGIGYEVEIISSELKKLK